MVCVMVMVVMVPMVRRVCQRNVCKKNQSDRQANNLTHDSIPTLVYVNAPWRLG